MQLLKDIEDWVEAEDAPRIFWLNGLAGTGKSTIARTIARGLYNRERLGASFFFSRGDGDSGSATKLVCTVALQVAQNYPDIREYIEAAILQNEHLVSLEVLNQWRKLILHPCSQGQSRDTTMVLVIDALDECGTHHDIVTILRILTLTASDGSTSLRVLLTSRPDGVIRDSFREMSEDSRQILVLHHIEPMVIDGDIKTFLRTELARIGLSRGHGGVWIGDEDISKLTQNSGDLFIWAATACRFIADGKQFARKRLQQLIGPSSAAATHPIRQLDQIYLTVLKTSVSTYTTDEKEEAAKILKQVLGSLAVLGTSLSLDSLSKILCIGLAEMAQALDDLHAIVDVPNQSTVPLQMHHPSFRDFLLSPGRCTKELFRVDEAQAHNLLAGACMQHLSAFLRRDLIFAVRVTLPSQSMTSAHLCSGRTFQRICNMLVCTYFSTLPPVEFTPGDWSQKWTCQDLERRHRDFVTLHVLAACIDKSIARNLFLSRWKPPRRCVQRRSVPGLDKSNG